ncbi:MAG TPA: helix-turn-helix transcriptional regulator [Terracidiphilus sp.]|jgi:predicted XRE-type DNA-binding protein|nr:helix-turn-helix transcriptional regulator [Terracidiphilus sp.]
MARKISAVTHVTRGNVFDDLGFTRSEATALKIKADLLDAIRNEIERKSYTQRQLASILDEHQPAVSNLLRGRIAQVSIEKLLRYSDRLGMRAKLQVLPAKRTATAA